MKKYHYLQIIADANLFWGIAGFLIIVAEGFVLLEKLKTPLTYRGTPNPITFNALSGHLFLASLFLIGSFTIGYYLHGLRRLALAIEQAKSEAIESGISITPDKKRYLKIVGYLLAFLGIGFTLFFLFLVFTLIFQNPADHEYVCDFDCGAFEPTPQDGLRWILFFTLGIIFTLALWGLSASIACLTVYRVKQVPHLYTDIIQQKSKPFGNIFLQILGFLSILCGIGTLTIIQLMNIVSFLPDLRFGWNYWFPFILFEGLIWVCGLGILGMGLTIYETQKLE